MRGSFQHVACIDQLNVVGGGVGFRGCTKVFRRRVLLLCVENNSTRPLHVTRVRGRYEYVRSDFAAPHSDPGYAAAVDTRFRNTGEHRRQVLLQGHTAAECGHIFGFGATVQNWHVRSVGVSSTCNTPAPRRVSQFLPLTSSK